MKNNYATLAVRRWLPCLLLLFATLTGQSLQAQVANYSFSSSSGAYQPIAGGYTVGNVTVDDNSWAGFNIGFPFFYNGQFYTNFGIQNNGFIAMGGASPASSYTNPSTGTTNQAIHGLNQDMQSQAPNGELRVETIGSAPNRTCVIQWSNYRYFAQTGDIYNFQIRLNETTNSIDVVYGSFTQNASNRTPAVGLRGATNADFNLRSVVAGTNDWTTSTAGAANTANCAMQTALVPPSGLTYTWNTGTAPIAPGTLTFTAVTATGMTLNWVDNSTDETNFLILRSLDNVNFVPAGTVASTSTAATGNPYTFVDAGLQSNTLYYYRVYATSGAGLSTPLSGQQTTLPGTMCGTYTIGPTGSYTSLTAALAALATNSLNCPVIFELQAAYVSTVETFPIVVPNTLGTSSTNGLTIRPETGATNLSITSAAASTVSFTGGKYVTFDGRPGGLGTAIQLTVANTATTGSAVAFTSDASWNALRYMNVRGVTTGTTNGVINFGVGVTTGNSNNTIANSDLGAGATVPSNMVYSNNTSTTAYNVSNTFNLNNIHDFHAAGGASNGINLAGANSAWTITNNSFYQTATRTATAGATHTYINLNTPNGSGFIINNNYVGGNAPSCSGTAVYNGAFASIMRPFWITTGPGPKSSINANFFHGWDFTTSSGTSGTPGVWCAIYNQGTGNVEIVANSVGSAVTSPSITVASTTSGATANGIANTSTGEITIQGNAVQTINANGSATVSTSIVGISSSGGRNIIMNNIVGSATVFNSLQNALSTSATSGSVTGIIVSSAVINDITNNQVMNLTSRYSGTGTGQVRGIVATSGWNTITNNQVGNLASLCPQALTTTSAGIIGIQMSSTTTLGASTVSQNTVSNLGNGAATGAVQVTGIYYSTNTTFATNSLHRNNVNSLGANTIGIAVLNGILVAGGTSNIYNNMVNLGIDNTGAPVVGAFEINGIQKTSTTNNNFYYNTVSIDGGGVNSAVANTYAFRRTGTATDVIKNNIFSNTRSNASTGGTHFCISLNATTTVTEDNNDFYGNGTGWVFGQVGATNHASLAAWKLATSLDANSFSVNPNFQTANNLHINNATASVLESRAAAVTGITIDIDGDTRPGPTGSTNGGGTASDIGADEFDGLPVNTDVGLSLLIRPVTGCPQDTVIYQVKNYANAVLNFAVNPVTVSGFTTGTNPTTFTNVLLNSGTLAGGATMNVVMSTSYNMTAAGTYTFRGATAMTADPISGNDSLPVTNFVVSGGNGAGNRDSLCLGDSLRLTVTGYTNGGSIQWQESPNNATWTNITGATTTPYMVTPTANTYYRAVICGLHNSTVDSVRVIVTPQAVTTGDTICGLGTANLSATGTGTLNWYGQQFGGANLNQGATYSPTVSTTTTYWVGNATGTANGLHTTTYAAGNGSSGNCFTVKALSNITITSFDGHLSSAVGTNSTWEIWYRPNDYLLTPGSHLSNVGWTLLGTGSTPSAGAGVPTAIPVALNLAIPAGSTYSFQIFTTTGSVNYTNGTTLGALYNANLDLEVYQGHGGTGFSGMVNNPRVFNGRIHYSSGCEALRVPVTATVTPPPAMSVSQSALASCSNAPVDLIASSIDPDYNYTWAPATDLNTTTNDSVIATPSFTTTYVVTATDTILGCVNTDTVTVLAAANPVITASVSNDTICAQDSVSLMGTVGTIAQVGNGTIANTGTGYPAPFGNWYWGSRHQMLVLASELYAANIGPGYLTSLSFDVTNLNTAVAHQNFEIKIGSTSATSITAFQTTPMTSVYTNASILPPLGISQMPFTTPFYWDGVSNILVETCHNNTAFTNNVSVNQTTMPFTSTVYFRADAAGVCGNNAVTASTADRPNMYFTYAPSYQYSWSPSGDVVNPTAMVTPAYPSASTGFVLTTTDSLSGCFAMDTTSVFAYPLPVVNLGNDGYYCGTSTTLDAGNPGMMYNWSTTDTTQTIGVNTSGSYFVDVTDTTGCSASDTIAITFTPFPVVNLGPDQSFCQGGSTILDAGITPATYSWSTTANTQTITVTTGGTYSVVVTDTFGCSGTDDVNVTVNALPNVTLNLGIDSLCTTSGAQTLSGGTPTGGAFSGTGVSSGSFDPNVAGVGTHVITYSYTDGNGCSNTATGSIVVWVCPGFEDGLNAFPLGLYPNPNDGRFTFTVPMDLTEEVYYEVTDARGHVVLAEKATQPSGIYKQQVRLDDFATGMYTLRVIVGDKSAQKRFVVQR